MTDTAQHPTGRTYPWCEFLTEGERAYLAQADAAHPVTFRERAEWRRRFAERARIMQRGRQRASAATKKGGAT